MMHTRKLLLKKMIKLKIHMNCMDKAKRLNRKTSRCQVVLKFQEKNHFSSQMIIINLPKKKKIKNKKVGISIILYQKLYQNTKNLNKNWYYNKWWILTCHCLNIKVCNRTTNQIRNRIHFQKNSSKRMILKVSRIDSMQLIRNFNLHHKMTLIDWTLIIMEFYYNKPAVR